VIQFGALSAHHNSDETFGNPAQPKQMAVVEERNDVR
jgi:hypothetical protein